MHAIPYIYIEIFFFSFCGTYLASQGCSPDQNLTIWNWENEEMVAQKAAPASEHYHLAFSHEHHTKITSCGKVFFRFSTFFLPIGIKIMIYFQKIYVS